MQTEEIQSVREFDGVRVVQVGLESLELVRALNERIFGEERIINTFDREDLMILVAYVDETEVGFKIGYRENRFLFYSAKGGVLSDYRGYGVARRLLEEMCMRARDWGYRRMAYDTFPNMHVGMTVLGLREGFRVVKADFNTAYNDFRLRLEKTL